jgi:hypothetical protein
MFFFLTCGQLACTDTESAANEPGVTRSDAATGTETDAASVRSDAAESDAFRADASVAAAAGSAGGGSQPADEAPYGSFSHIYEVAFRSCRTQCHAEGFSNLNMATREAAYAALVDQDSNPRNMNCAHLGLKRVKPGAPDESLLYLKLDINAPCGQQMPPGGTLKKELQDEVRAWISDGAKDD